MSGNNRGGRGGPFRAGGPSTRGNAPARGAGPPYRGAGSGAPSSHRGGGGGRGGRGGPRQAVIFKGGSPATVQPHLSDQSLSTLVASLSPLRNTPERPVRPGFGTLGTPIKLRANFFALKIKKGQKFYEYNVIISGPKEKLPNGMKIRLFELLELHANFVRHNSYIAHDRTAKIYSAKPLPQPSVSDIKYFDDHKKGPEADAAEYRVELEYVKEHDLSALNEYAFSLL